MSEGSLKREEELFTSALALPEVERERYLARACAGNRALLARVTGLLEKFAAAERVMEDQPWAPAIERVPAEARGEERPGDHIDEYRLVQEIGEGGGGVVYLAEQGAPMRREVALKIIKLGMDTRAVIARFEAERQTLAMMDHPNIARVFDAGATPSGRPYFVMELVRGIRITDYCDQGHLCPAERLALFIQTCYAVQHAHQKGIVHRDIKPSNVLVTLHDGVPLVKVIDFGIAKAMAGRLTDETLHTVLGQFVGTPAYVSPEQIESGSFEIDDRSDIYSLGVLLYELLTGCLPSDSSGLEGVGFEGMKQRIREEDPPTPSRRLRALGEEQLAFTAERRRTSRARLIQLLHGDLDWIVMRCLEKEPVRRYARVGDLVEDLQRYLRHEPIVARPRRLVYVFGKFARRNRVVFATGAAIFAVLIVATGFSSWLAVRAIEAERLAQLESASRQQVIDFLQHDLLEQASPAEEPDRDLRLRTVLDRASERIEGRFPGQPLIEADVRETLARTYDSLGEYEQAQRHVEVALEIRRRELGPEHAKTLLLMSYSADLSSVLGRYEEAEALSVRTLEIQRRVLGPEHLQTLGTSVNLAVIHHSLGRFDEAARELEQTLAIQRRVLGPEHEETLVSMNNLALAYRNQGKFAEATLLHEEEYAIARRVQGAEHPDTLTSMSNLSVAYSDEGRFAQAEALLREALEIATRVSGSAHPETLVLRHNLANAHLDRGSFAEAERMQLDTLAESLEVLGEHHPNTIKIASLLAMIHRSQGRLAEARSRLDRTLETSRAVQGADHPVSIVVLSNLAWVLEEQGELTEAEALLRDATARAAPVFGVAHPLTLRFRDQHGGVLLGLKRYAEAEEILRDCVTKWQRASPEDWRAFNAKSQLGAALIALGRFDEAEALLLESHEGLQKRRHTVPAGSAAVFSQSAARIENLYLARGDEVRAKAWASKKAL